MPRKIHSGEPLAGADGAVLLPSLALDRTAGTPLHQQLKVQLAAAIAGRHRGRRLPSTRVLAGLLDVSRNTVITAYEDLVADGMIEPRRGVGMVVSGVSTQPRSPLRLLSETQYPARTITLSDPDGAAFYISY